MGTEPGGDPGDDPVIAEPVEATDRRLHRPHRRSEINGRHEHPPGQIEDRPDAAEEGEHDERQPNPDGVDFKVGTQAGGNAREHAVVPEAIEAARGWCPTERRYRPARRGGRPALRRSCGLADRVLVSGWRAGRLGALLAGCLLHLRSPGSGDHPEAVAAVLTPVRASRSPAQRGPRRSRPPSGESLEYPGTGPASLRGAPDIASARRVSRLTR